MFSEPKFDIILPLSIILPFLSEAHPLLKTVCMNINVMKSANFPATQVCMNIGFSLLGFTPGQLNGTMVGLEQSKLLSKIHNSTCVGVEYK